MNLKKLDISQKIRINVKLSEKVCLAVREHMLKNGYTLREKSKWYSEAIHDFINMPDFPSYVHMAALIEQQPKSENFYVSRAFEDTIENAIIEVRKYYPTLEGVKSLIVRASIIQRLLPIIKIN